MKETNWIFKEKTSNTFIICEYNKCINVNAIKTIRLNESLHEPLNISTSPMAYLSKACISVDVGNAEYLCKVLMHHINVYGATEEAAKFLWDRFPNVIKKETKMKDEKSFIKKATEVKSKAKPSKAVKAATDVVKVGNPAKVKHDKIKAKVEAKVAVTKPKVKAAKPEVKPKPKTSNMTKLEAVTKAYSKKMSRDKAIEFLVDNLGGTPDQRKKDVVYWFNKFDKEKGVK